MSGEVTSLAVAVVGVFGTLASAIFTQKLTQKGKLQELEHAERVRLDDQRAAEEQRRLDLLRSTYIQLISNDRHYRDAMLAYAYAVQDGRSGEAELEEIASARRAQRDARAEAQIIASEEILQLESNVAFPLTNAYQKLMLIQQTQNTEHQESTLQEVIDILDDLISKMSHVRAVMRLELGVIDELPEWFSRSAMDTF